MIKIVASNVSKKVNEIDHIFNSKETIYNWMITNLKVTIFIIQKTLESSHSVQYIWSVFKSGHYSSHVHFCLEK